MTAKVLEVQNLKVFPVKTNLFGRGTEFVKAVDGVDFHINSGEILGLVGESGRQNHYWTHYYQAIGPNRGRDNI